METIQTLTVVDSLGFPFLDIFLIEDIINGGYTGLFKQVPELMVEGDSKEETISNLFDALHDVFINAIKQKL